MSEITVSYDPSALLEQLNLLTSAVLSVNETLKTLNETLTKNKPGRKPRTKKETSKTESGKAESDKTEAAGKKESPDTSSGANTPNPNPSESDTARVSRIAREVVENFSNGAEANKYITKVFEKYANTKKLSGITEDKMPKVADELERLLNARKTNTLDSWEV